MEFREEIANHIIGNIPLERWDEMAYGLFEAIVDDTLQVGFKAVNMQDAIFNKKLYSRNFLGEEVERFFWDYGSKIATQVNYVSENTTNQHRWAYKLLPNLNLLVGSDPRDTAVDPAELEPLPPDLVEDDDYGY